MAARADLNELVSSVLAAVGGKGVVVAVVIGDGGVDAASAAGFDGATVVEAGMAAGSLIGIAGRLDASMHDGLEAAYPGDRDVVSVFESSAVAAIAKSAQGSERMVQRFAPPVDERGTSIDETG